MIRLMVALGTAALPVLAGAVPAPVPEPSTILLMGGGLAALALVANRRRRK